MMEHTLHCGDCLEIMRAMPDASVDLVVTSPPYPGKLSRYGTSIRMPDMEWSTWMCVRVVEMARVCRGMVGVVANGRISKSQYTPAIEALLVDCWRMGIRCERPTIWHKNAPPNRRDWFGNDWEPVLWFYGATCTRKTWEWERIATAPAFTSGGHFRQRDSHGKRRRGSDYPTSTLTRPRDVHRVLVGGGHMGATAIGENEAPFPESLVEPFVLALSNPGDVVLDPFCGEGTTLAVAAKYGRRSIGIDVRESQIELSRRRLREVGVDAPL